MQLLLDSKKDKKKSMVTETKITEIHQINDMKRQIDELKRLKKDA